MRVGIFFGGASREREISFAGGRTVYDNLNKQLFTPVPIFVDSLNRLILLEWPYIYKGTIRDFYPPDGFAPQSNPLFRSYIESLNNLSPDELDRLIEKVGRRVYPHQLPELIDFAFLCLHGAYGEDGSIQGLLKWYKIPYTGSGILPSALGMNKAIQKKWMKQAGFASKPCFVIPRAAWSDEENNARWFEKVRVEIGLPCVIRPANQGSSIGVTIIYDENEEAFDKAVDKAFFTRFITWDEWQPLTEQAKTELVLNLTDIREGLGLPLSINDSIFYTQPELIKFLDNHFKHSDEGLWLVALDGESDVLIEGFISGKEFSCIVIRNLTGEAIALPPTEIIKGGEVFDYRSKYLAGLSRKVTPIEIPDAHIQAIRHECERLFTYFEFNTYARIDGFIQADGTIYLNDPNTTSGMLPSSFFFHQAAEIGLNPSQFLTFIIYTSLKERINTESLTVHNQALLEDLDNDMAAIHSKAMDKKTVGVILGGYSSERHISVESGRNVYEKLSASDKYQPVPLFLTGNDGGFELYTLPLNLLLKDNADDIAQKIKHYNVHAVIQEIREQCASITGKFATAGYVFEPRKIAFDNLPSVVDDMFIALHGRPGEDGTIQKLLEQYNIPYNGSDPRSSQITIDKYKTLELLRQHGFVTANQKVVHKNDWLSDKEAFYSSIENDFIFPLICKPVDDGCSSAVKKIKNKEELEAYFDIAFRNNELDMPAEASTILQLKPKEEFPVKTRILVETLIEKGKAVHFMEITGGMLMHKQDDGRLVFEVFEPSEALAGKDVLSLEEKFLAGEGQNITPARFSPNPVEQARISKTVRADLQRAAEILGVQGYCRIDAFVRVYEDGNIETVIIEVNSLPGMTPATVIYHQAALNGYKPFDFIDKILEFAETRVTTAL